MGKMSKKLSLLLMKQQTTFGTAESSLAGTDVIETIGAPTLTLNPETTKIDLVAGAFDQDKSVPGAMNYELQFQAYMRTGNAQDDLGQIGTILPWCGMTSSETTDSYAWTFSSTRTAWKDATAWMYTGDLSTSGAILYKSGNILLVPKWTFEAGKPTILEVSGMGTYEGPPAAATQPSITKMRVSPPAFMNTSALTLNGDSDYQIISGEIDAGVQADLTKDPSQTWGRGASYFTDRKVSFSFTVYAATDVTPYDNLGSQTEGALTITYGTAPNSLSWASSYAQIENIEQGEEGGVETWTISGQINRNDLTLTMDTTES